MQFPLRGFLPAGAMLSTQAFAGAVCRVGLSQRVVEAPEALLAHDFEAGDRVLHLPRSGPALEGTVERIDAAVWYVMLSLCDRTHLSCCGCTVDGARSPKQQSSLSIGGSARQCVVTVEWHKQARDTKSS